MSKIKLTEERLRDIIQEEYINENFALIVESDDLFEAKKGKKTNAASALGDAVSLLRTPEGRRVIGQVFRLPYVITKIPERAPYMFSKTTFDTDKKEGFKKFFGSLGYLMSGPFKLITKPLALIGDKIRDMDDKTALMIVSFINGKIPNPDDPGVDESDFTNTNGASTEPAKSDDNVSQFEIPDDLAYDDEDEQDNRDVLVQVYKRLEQLL